MVRKRYMTGSRAIQPRSQEVQFVTRPVYPLTRPIRFMPKVFQPVPEPNVVLAGQANISNNKSFYPKFSFIYHI